MNSNETQSSNQRRKAAASLAEDEVMYAKEYWTGDSRDGAVVNGEGYHYYRMSSDGLIVEAYEFYETDEGIEVASPLPEMVNIDWKKDLGFDDLEALDIINESEFSRIKELTQTSMKS